MRAITRYSTALAAGAALAAAIAIAAPAGAQSIADRVAAVRTGTVRLSYAAAPGVCGNGRNINTHSSSDEWESDCERGPVRVSLRMRDGEIVDINTYVGGRWRGTGATDLGQVPSRQAAEYLLALAERGRPAGKDAIFAATIADSIEAWPRLLRLARNDRVPRETRKSAVFWVGQSAADQATKGLTELAEEETADQQVRESAIFALSQQPDNVGVPALIKVARSSHDARLRRKALFWLGQKDDPRVLDLYEQILSEGR